MKPSDQIQVIDAYVYRMMVVHDDQQGPSGEATASIQGNDTTPRRFRLRRGSVFIAF
jgi:hypothetical protein